MLRTKYTLLEQFHEKAILKLGICLLSLLSCRTILPRGHHLEKYCLLVREGVENMRTQCTLFCLQSKPSHVGLIQLMRPYLLEQDNSVEPSLKEKLETKLYKGR